MAKSGLTPLFSENDLEKGFEGLQLTADRKILEILKYVGERFINEARHLRTYKDRTGNLRSSIGYIIALDGKIIEKSIKASGTARRNAERSFEEVLTRFNKGYVLIGVAGMEYAASVESKGYDVITGPALGAEQIMKRLVKEIIG